MFSSTRIITLGLTDDQNNTVKKHLGSIKYQISCDSYIDILTANYFASIVNVKKLNDDELKSIINFYSNIDGNLTKKIFISNNTNTLSQVSGICIYESFEALEKDLADMLRKAYKKSKNAEANAANLSNAIFILSQIKKHPGITTDVLSNKINRKSSVVLRYIEVLRIAGEHIDYDKELKGWRLKNNKSILMDVLQE